LPPDDGIATGAQRLPGDLSLMTHQEFVASVARWPRFHQSIATIKAGTISTMVYW